MDSIRHDIALKIVGLSDRGEITLDAIERLLIAYDSIKQDRIRHRPHHEPSPHGD